MIWARTDPDNPCTRTEITTQQMLKTFAAGIDTELISDLRRNREMLIEFFKWGNNQQINYQTAIDALFNSRFDNIHEVEKFFEENRLNEYFDNLGENPRYLPGKRRSMDFLSSSRAITTALREEKKYQATALIALNCMVLAIYPENLPDNLRRALLAPWREPGVFDLSDDPMELQISWEKLDPNKEPALHVIGSNGIVPRKITVKSKFHEDVNIRIPVGGQLAAIRVGQNVTCIRGSICVNGSYAACVQSGEIIRYRLRDGNIQRKKLNDPESTYDLALDSSGRYLLLEGTTATIWDCMEQFTIDGVISLCTCRDVWVILYKNGQTFSNFDPLCLKDVIAVAQDEGDILLMARDGKIHSLYQKEYTQKDFWNCMMSRFLNLPENVVERLNYADRKLLRTYKGDLEVK